VIGIKESCLAKILSEFHGQEESIDRMIERSLLRDDIKADYASYYKEKMKRLNDNVDREKK